MESFQLSSMIYSGGPTLIILAVAFIVSCIIIIERWVYFKDRAVRPAELLLDAGSFLERKQTSDLKERFRKEKSPAGYVLSECMILSENVSVLRTEDFEEVKDRAVAEKLPEMERYLNILATLGSVSPFIGLLGTVIGIIRAFVSLDMGTAGTAGLNAGIAEALVATAGGLLVAIPSTAAFNYYKKKVEYMIMQIEISASRLKMLILAKREL